MWRVSSRSLVFQVVTEEENDVKQEIHRFVGKLCYDYSVLAQTAQRPVATMLHSLVCIQILVHWQTLAPQGKCSKWA